jgi:hypothetical protein
MAMNPLLLLDRRVGIHAGYAPRRKVPVRETAQVTNLLPNELRLPHVLSHIARSIENMNLRLKGCESLLQRYSATYADSAPERWKEKLRRGLHPADQGSIDRYIVAPALGALPHGSCT